MKLELNLQLFGGRGNLFFPKNEIFINWGSTGGGGNNKKLNVAGLTPDAGNYRIRRERSLDYLENYHTIGLKKENVYLINRQGYVTDGYEGNRRSVGIYLNRNLNYEDYIVTHNHPDNYGGGFSKADIKAFTNLNLNAGFKELRASTQEGTWRLSRNHNIQMNLDGFIKVLTKYRTADLSLKPKLEDFKDAYDYDKEYRKWALRNYEMGLLKEGEKFGYNVTFEPFKGERQRRALTVDKNDIIETRKEFEHGEKEKKGL